MFGFCGSINNPADLARLLQTDVIPRCAAIGGFVDAVAGREVLTNVALAGSGINGLGSDGATASAPIEATPGRQKSASRQLRHRSFSRFRH
jgi:hypothetical protein